MANTSMELWKRKFASKYNTTQNARKLWSERYRDKYDSKGLSAEKEEELSDLGLKLVGPSTVPVSNESKFTTPRLDFDTISRPQGFEAWTKQKAGEEARERSDNTVGIVNQENRTIALPDYMADAKSKPSALNGNSLTPVFDAGTDIDSYTLAGIRVQVPLIQKEISELEKEWNNAVLLPEIAPITAEINDLQAQKNALSNQMTVGRQDRSAEIKDLEQKIADLQADASAKIASVRRPIEEKISEKEEKIFSMYGSLMSRSDFADKSKYVSTRKKDENGNYVEPSRPVLSKKYSETGYGDVKYDAINRDEKAKSVYDNNRYFDDQLGVKGGASYSEMSNDEISIYNYLYATSGKATADAFLDVIERDLSARKRYRVEEGVQNFANKNALNAALVSVGSIAATPAKSAVGAMGTVADYFDDGRIDQNAPYNRISHASSAARESVSNQIEEHWGPVGSFAYNVGMSMGDFLLTTAVSGGNPALSMTIMGSGAAADTVISAKDRGLSDNQAFALGVVAGLAEAITEKFSIDALFDTIKAGKGAVIKYIGKNVLSEGTEEVGSSLINLFADVIVSRDKSEWNQKIRYYMSKDGGGLSEKDAIQKAVLEQAGSLGLDFLGGAISGGVMGGGSAAIQSVSGYASMSPIERQLNRDIKRRDTQRAAMDALINANGDKKINAAAKFVNTTAKYAEKGVNAVNAACDFIRAEANAVYRQIKAIDEAGAPSTLGEQEKAQKERTELQTRLNALVETDKMLRENRTEIETARKRKENVEFADPGEYDPEAVDSEDVLDVAVINDEIAQGYQGAENSEDDSSSPYVDSRVEEAFKTAQVDVNMAANDLRKAYGGDLRSAIYGLKYAAAKINQSSVTNKRDYLDILKSIDDSLRENNAAYIEEKTQTLKRNLSKYGVKNVLVGGSEFTGYGNVGRRASYDRRTGVLTVSPYINQDAVLAAAVVHEFTHHGAVYDLSLVNDTVELIEKVKADGRINLAEFSNKYDWKEYYNSYQSEVSDFIRSSEGRSAIKRYTDGGMVAAQAQEQVIKDYVNEEMAADFLGDLINMDKNNENFQKFVNDNRSLIRRVLDAISNFIRRLKGEDADTNVTQYERAAELLRDVLNKGTESKTEIKDVNRDAGKKLSKEEVENDSSLRYSIEVDADGKRFVQVKGDSLEGIADTEIPKVLAALVRSKFNTWVEVNGQKIGINSKTVGEWVHSNDAKKLQRQSPEAYSDKMSAFENADELLKVSKDYINEALKHERKDDFDSFARGTVDFKVNDNGYTADIVVGVKKNGVALLYDIVNINSKKIAESSDTTPSANAVDRRQENSADNSIADSNENVNTSDEKSDVRFSKDVGEKDFTYQSLTSKPDMPVVELTPPDSYNGESRPPRDAVVRAAIDNARSKHHPRNNYTSTYVKNKDTGRDILVGAKSITHGLNRKYENNAIASAHIGDLIENAILINEHTAREGGTEGGIYLSAGKIGDELYLCRIITNEDNAAESVEVMYALNAKKEPVAHYRLDFAEDLLPVNTDSSLESDAKYRNDSAERFLHIETDSTISIADLLSLVKKYFADVLPQDVLDTMNITRPNSSVSDSVRYAKDVGEAKIRPGMTDADRYEALKNRVILIKAKPDYEKLRDYNRELEGIDTLRDTQKKTLLRKLGEQFGVFKRYNNVDIALEFNYSYGNLKNSVEKQKQNRNYENFAKMLSCFDDIVDSAIGVEVHNRNGEYKTDDALKNMYVLVSAFEDGNSIVPVKLEVKEFNDANINNTLYVTVALERIEKDRIVTAPSPDMNQNYAAPLSTISIADLFANVNTADGSFLKYIPDGFLDENQRSAKAEYIEREAERIANEGVRHAKDVADTRSIEDKLRAENEYLKRQFMDYLGDKWTGALNDEVITSISQSVAKSLPHVARSDVKAEIEPIRKILQRRVTDTYSAEKRYADAKEAALSAARNIIDSGRNIEVSDEWLEIRDLKKKLRTTKMFINEEIQNSFSDWNAVRKEMSSALSVTQTDTNAIGVDAFYRELAGEYPEFFPTDIIGLKQQAERIVDVARELKMIRQYKSESLWASESETMDAEEAEAKNNAFVDAVSNGILAEFATVAAKQTTDLIKQKDKVLYGNTRAAKMLYRDIAREMTQDAELASEEAYRVLRRINHGKEVESLSKARKRNLSLLNRLYGYVTNPTAKKHVPPQIVESVAKLLEIFSGQKLTNGKVIDRDTLRKASTSVTSFDPDKVVSLLESMRKTINKEKSQTESTVSDDFIPEATVSDDFIKEMTEKIQMVREDFQEKADVPGAENFAEAGQNYYKQAEIDALNEINEILCMVQNYIDMANEVFIGEKTESASKFAERLIDALKDRAVGKTIKETTEHKSTQPSWLIYRIMKPNTFWNLFGKPGVEIMRMFRTAQDAEMLFQAKWTDYMSEVLEDERNRTGKKYTTGDKGWGRSPIIITADGKTIRVTKAQLMAAYASWFTPGGKDHMTVGGMYFLDENRMQKRERRIRFSEETFLSQVVKNLSESDIRVLDAAVRFMSKKGAEVGNQAALQIFGFEKFKIGYYFPLLTADVGIQGSVGGQRYEATYERRRYTRPRKTDAVTPLVADNFFDIVDFHVTDIGGYAAWAPLLNDVKRIFSIGAVKDNVNTALGGEASRYLDWLIGRIEKNKVKRFEDIAGGLSGTSLTNFYKRQAVSGRLSSVVKQFLSFPRALRNIELKYLLKSYASWDAIPWVAKKEIKENMLKYSGVANIKLQGYSDAGIGKSVRALYDTKYSSADNVRFKPGRVALKAYEKVTDFGMWGAGKADEAVWLRIWRACEEKVKAEHSGFNHEDSMRKVAEIFNEVIGETQVVDSSLDTAPIMSSKDGRIRIWFAFQSEAIQSVNGMYSALDQVKNSKNDESRRKDGVKKLGVSVASFIFSSILAEPFISALFSMGRDEEDEEGRFWNKVLDEMFAVDTFRDKEAKWYDKVLALLSSNSVGALYQNIPFVEEICSAVISDLNNYDVSRMDVSGLTKAISAVWDLLTYDPKTSRKTYVNTTIDAIAKIGDGFGIPFSTFKKGILGTVRIVLQASDNYVYQWELNKFLYNLNNGNARSQKNFYDIIANVIRDGDEDAYQYIRNDISNVFTGERKGLSANDMLRYMEGRKVEFDYTSRLWYIELQANFDLPTFNSNMLVEPLITAVYKRTGEDSVLPSPPTDHFDVSAYADLGDKLEFASESDYNPIKEDEKIEYSRTVTFKNQADLAEYTEKVGFYAYKTLAHYASSTAWSLLTDDQKVYAIEQAYAFARAKYKAEYCSAYSPNNKGYQDLIRNNANPSTAAQLILENASDQ